MAIEGFLEVIKSDWIAGWAFDSNNPTMYVAVELRTETRIIARMEARNYRADLASAGKGAGDHAFLVTPFPLLNEGELGSIVARAFQPDGQTVELPRLNSPLWRRNIEPPQPVQEDLVERRFRHGILHIGMEKTGTTSLQRSLALNRSRLRSQGFFVPRSLAPHASEEILNHIGLAAYALDISNDNEPIRSESGCIGPERVSAYRENLLKALLSEITNEASGCHTLLVSSEHCQSRLFLFQEITRLRNLLLSLCDDVQVVLYLRAQHEVAVSSHSTILKDGAIHVDVFPPASELTTMLYDYDAMVARWEVVFGSDKVVVKLYCSDIVTDFLLQIGVDVDSLMPLPRRENMSLDAVGEQTLALVNRALSGLPDAGGRRIRAALVEALEATHPGTGVLPPRHEAEAFQGRFGITNERLWRRRFPQRQQLFHEDFSVYPENVFPQAPLTPDAMAQVMAGVVGYLAFGEEP